LKFADINRNSSGFFPYPADYGAYDYMQYGYVYTSCGNSEIKWKRVEAVTGGERVIRLESHVIPPTAKKPICSWNEIGWIVDPAEIKQVRLHYMRLPATPFRNYVMQGQQDVYDATGSPASAFPGRPSRNTDWPDSMFGDFVIRVCRYAGINLREDELVQFALNRQLMGQ